MANELIAFADAEALAVTWLTGKLGTGVAISTQVPNPRPDKHVKVIAVGARRTDLAYREARLVFECWATNETDASAIAELVDAHMNGAEAETVGGSFIRRVSHVGGPVNSADPESNTPRYLVTKAITYRGAAL